MRHKKTALFLKALWGGRATEARRRGGALLICRLLGAALLAGAAGAAEALAAGAAAKAPLAQKPGGAAAEAAPAAEAPAESPAAKSPAAEAKREAVKKPSAAEKNPPPAAKAPPSKSPEAPAIQKSAKIPAAKSPRQSQAPAPAAEPAAKAASPAADQRAMAALKKILRKYSRGAVFMKIKTDLFLPSAEKSVSGAGSLAIHGQKFRLKIQGDPPYAMIFDGKTFWHQPDMREKLVFKFEDHPMAALISGIFHPERFFELFSPERFARRGSKYGVQLKLKKKLADIEGLAAVFESHIESVQILWGGLGSRQSYKFQNPWFKAGMPASAFAFPAEGFEVISKDSL